MQIPVVCSWREAALALGLALASAGSADAQQALPIQTTLLIDDVESTQTLRADLASVPTRPVLVIEATPDTEHPDAQLQFEVTNWLTPNVNTGGNCPYRNFPEYAYVSTPGTGLSTFVVALYPCTASVLGWAGASVDVKVRLVTLGSNTAPANVSIRIRGETRPPTSTAVQQVDTQLGAKQSVIPARIDTTIYQHDSTWSNGAGEFLWAGEERIPPFFRRKFRSLLSFDVSAAVPPTAVVDSATLQLQALGFYGGGGPLTLYRVTPGALGPWSEGDANAAGNELVGTQTLLEWGAGWQHRRRPDVPWSTPGGDYDPNAWLVTTSLVAPGPVSLSSSALRQVVETMVTTEIDEDGFLLEGPNTALSDTSAIQLASRENPNAAHRPRLVVDYTQTQIYESGSLTTGVVSYINEGQNFRWLYDLDQDDVYVSPVGGICEVTPTGSPNFLPYRYSFAGAPGFTGLDCCTWKIDSPQTGTIGTGQLLFYHGLDPNDPANDPADVDLDGIVDLCDNCPSIANGPLLGTCKSGSAIGSLCNSNADCPGAGACDLAQEDADGNFQGNACPEPGVAGGIASGLVLLGLLGSRRAALERQDAFPPPR